jgi:hypothetical protein
MEHYYAITVAEGICAILGGMLLGVVLFSIVFIIIRRKHDNS